MYDCEHMDELRDRIDLDVPKSPFDCLMQVSVDVSNVCNQRCPFCPQSNGWISRHGGFMSVKTAGKISERLDECGFRKRVMVCGKGEPMLNPEIEEIIKIFSVNHDVSLITNGIDEDVWRWTRICRMCSEVLVSCHDWKNVQEYEKRFAGIKNIRIRNHDSENPSMYVTNRGGFFDFGRKENGVCGYPFYHFDIEPDGTYKPCGQNWVLEYRHDIEPLPNVFNMSITDYFLTEMEPIRKSLVIGGRFSCDYCKNCDCIGTLVGQKLVEYWRKTHER